MSPESPRARRAGTRLAAVAAASAVVAAAFAAPASAAVPGIAGDPIVDLSLSPTVTAGSSAPGSITVDYTPAAGAENDTHVVAAELVVDGSAEVIELTTANGFCDASATYQLDCVDSDADTNTVFGFDLAAVAAAEDETFDYVLKVTIDGTEVASSAGTFAVQATYDVHNPYAHSDIVRENVAEGTTVTVNPVIYQDFDLAPTAAAVVVSFSDALAAKGIDTSGLATAFADFDNCKVAADAAEPGVVCVITEFPDTKGQFLTLTAPVSYAIADDVVGPLDVCACTYSVATVNAETLASEYGFLNSTEMTGSSLGLAASADGFDGAEDSIAYFGGTVTLTTADNRYDLTVQEIDLNGEVGDTTSVTTTIANNGPAAADDLRPEGDTYLVRAQMPEGVQVVRVDSDGQGTWDCYTGAELEEAYATASFTYLERFDLACSIDGFEPGETADLTFTVQLDDTSAYQGAIELTSFQGAHDYDGDFDSDFALIYNNATEVRYDYNQDGYEDLLVVRKSDGMLVLYRGNGTGGYRAGVVDSSGWGRMDIVMGGDLTGDDLPDLLARDNKTGALYTYPGNGQGGFRPRITAGSGWGTMGQIAVGNFDGDGMPDVFATSYRDGNMYYYPGLGNGKFGSRIAWSEWWDGMDVISSIGDLDGDGIDEYLTRFNQNGRYYVYTAAGAGEVYELDQSLHDWVYTRRYDQVVGAGDLNDDGAADFVSADLKTGQLVRRTFDPASPYAVDGTVIGSSGWNTVRLPVIQLDRSYDYDYDGFSDFIAQQKSSKDLFLYWGTGSGHGERWNMCDDCSGISAVSAGGDYNSDSRIDMLYRTTNGELWIAPGVDDGGIGFTYSALAGTGWNSMANITGGHDYNSDGRDDLIARNPATGYLHLYLGKGDGKFGTRLQMGTGWNGMRDITAAGDLNHDGHADVLAIRNSDGCLYLYAGRGNGTVKSGVQISCGWNSYDQITGVGDYSRDGHADWLARRATDGALYLYYGNGNGGWSSRKQIGTGWNTMAFLG